MTEILHFAILRKHGQTNTQTHKQTDMDITIPRPPPMGGGGRGNDKFRNMYVSDNYSCVPVGSKSVCDNLNTHYCL